MEADVIASESFGPVMKELQNQLHSVLTQTPTETQVEALNCFVSTMWIIIAQLFSWMPPEEIREVSATCGTMFGIGILFGKSPELLVKILDKANPTLEKREMPDWLVAMLEDFKKYER